MYVSQIAHTHTDHFDTHTHTHVLSADVHICNVKHLRIRSLSRISARVDFYSVYSDNTAMHCIL